MVFLCDCLTQYGLWHLRNHFAQRIARPSAIGNHRRQHIQRGYLPTLADIVLLRQLLPVGEALAAPYHRTQIGLEEDGVELGALRLNHAAHRQHTYIRNGVQLVGLEVLHEDKILLLAVMHLSIDGDVNLTIQDKERILQIWVDMLRTALARLQLQHRNLSNAASALIGREQYTLETHLIGGTQGRYIA